MSKKNQISYKLIFTTILGVLALLYFGIVYPYHLHFAEELQLFEYTRAYAVSVLSVPGGLADYISRWLTQFFYYHWLGAVIISLLLVLLQYGVWRLMLRRSNATYALSALPVVAVWSCLCNENTLLTLPVSVIASVWGAVALVQIKSKWSRTITTYISIILGYLLVGPVSVIMPFTVIVYEWLRKETTSIKIILTLGSLLIAWLTLTAAHQLFAYNSETLARGIHYFRFLHIAPIQAWIAVAVTTVTPLLSVLIPDMKKAKMRHVLTAVVTFCISLIGYFWIKDNTDLAKEEVYAFDYLANQGRFEDIVKRAETHRPDNPYTVACLNLALGMTGRMGDTMFGYMQNGVEGLFPPFVIDFTNPLPTSEVLYQLGMVNAAQRYVFEANEALPDYQRSSRATRRLAEISIINGDYKTARKYLKTLSNTHFYKDWAKERLAMTDNPETIDSHPEYGLLRKYKCTTDAFMEENPSEMLLPLIVDRPENRLAIDYIIATALLQCDLNKFNSYIEACGYPAGYVLPRHYQEAFALMWVHDHKSWDGIPWKLNPEVMRGIESFLRDQQSRMPSDYMHSRYGNTYWYYFFKHIPNS